MARKIFFFGTPAMVLALSFGVVLAGCGSNPKAAGPDLTGTWVDTEGIEVIFADAYSGSMRTYNAAGESTTEVALTYSWKDSALTLSNGTKVSAKVEGDAFTIIDLLDEPFTLRKVSNANIREGKWKYTSDDGSYQILLFNADGSASWARYAADGTENGSGTFVYKPFGRVANMEFYIPEMRGRSVKSEIAFPFITDNFNKLVFKFPLLGEMVFEKQ